ncbi:hypothetical protein KIN20_027948 [Parelaphostrongylus tenuis]|uniref:Uncharacterized protein n=1 Tax=Parelaphostrongylus tenuis TaxID=148309 RepID=A0AAD5R009_PARTN|nr:hypothetical protein KIN20_027948 [Parelaphostrongylus tenuis]
MEGPLSFNAQSSNNGRPVVTCVDWGSFPAISIIGRGLTVWTCLSVFTGTLISRRNYWIIVDCVDVVSRFPPTQSLKEKLYEWSANIMAKRVTYWNPIGEGMNRLKVITDIPVIFIMLSRDPYSSELQCMSMQLSLNKKVELPMSKIPLAKSGENKSKQSISNECSQPSRNTEEAEAAERS